jgi:hypothetical protein
MSGVQDWPSQAEVIFNTDDITQRYQQYLAPYSANISRLQISSFLVSVMEPIPSLKQLELLQSYGKVHEDYARICSLCPNLTSLIATKRGRRKSPK